MDINKLFKELSSLQKQAQEKQGALEEKEFVGTAASGLVSVTLKGTYECLSIKIDKELISENDEEMLEDVLLLAFNDAIKQIQKEIESISSSMTNGMGF